MRNLRSTLTIILLALLAGCSSTPTTPTPDGLTESATLFIREGQVMSLAVGGTGEGNLIFQGWQYPIHIEGMHLSGVGNSAVDLEGAVYNLEKLEDFEGSYAPMKADVKAGDGLVGLWSKNEKGVVVHVRALHQDVQINFHGTGAKVTFK